MTTADQAAELRKLAGRRFASAAPSCCQFVAITSGKGGVGKTNVVINLAIALRRTGKTVAILDGDFGLANVDVLLGVVPQFHLGHVVEGVQTIESIIIQGPEQVDVIPASSGLQEMAELSEARQWSLIREMSDAVNDYDYLLIDTAAGISSNVMRLLMVARRVIVVAAPEPTAVVDAYALMKVLFGRDPEKDVMVLVNGSQDEREAREIFQQLDQVCRQFLGQQLEMLGFLPEDDRIRQSIRRQLPVLISHPRARISRCFRNIASRLNQCPPVAGQLENLMKETV